jgi:hypothetical protein
MGAEILTTLVGAGAGIAALIYGGVQFFAKQVAANPARAAATGVAGALVDRDIGDRLIDQFERLNMLIDHHSRESLGAMKRSSEEMIELRKVMQQISEKIPRQ